MKKKYNVSVHNMENPYDSFSHFAIDEHFKNGLVRNFGGKAKYNVMVEDCEEVRKNLNKEWIPSID